MKFKLLIILLIFLTSCTQNYYNTKSNKKFYAKGFAYIYNASDYEEKLLTKRLDKNSLQIAHAQLRPGVYIKIINMKTNDSITLKNTNRFNYPEFYKISITQPVADKINLDENLPLVEIFEVKKNKSYIAKKTKIYNEEKKIESKAPVESIQVDNISKNKIKKNKINDKFYITIAEFYSKQSALNLKKRIVQELSDFNSNKLIINTKKANKISLFSGPYTSINSMKNDYIKLKILVSKN